MERFDPQPVANWHDEFVLLHFQLELLMDDAQATLASHDQGAAIAALDRVMAQSRRLRVHLRTSATTLQGFSRA
jgi:hypothetical protein